MAIIELKTVNGVTIASLKKIAIFYFGKQLFLNLREKDATIVIFLDQSKVRPEDMGKLEQMREKFEIYWQVTVKLV